MLRKTTVVILWTAALVLRAPMLHAQFDTAAVLGTIRDATGGVVSGAVVTLQNVNTGIAAKFVTDASGNYEFLDVKAGTYKLEAAAAGFSTSVAEAFPVAVSARQRVDLVLRVGAVTDKIDVIGAANLLESDSSGRGQVIEREQVVDLPLNGRSYADLALLTTGVRKGLRDDREASYNVNGLRFELNNFQLDGVDNNAYATSNVLNSNQVLQISPDAIEEYSVQTNNYSAEYGHAAGAIINATIRSGTNKLHVVLWEFDRNTVLNATGFFKPVSGVKPVLRKNQFGLTIGGPIWRDRTFYFADYEGNRLDQESIVYSVVPTVAQRQGIMGAPVVNPVTGTTYTNGIVPVSDITSFAQKVLAGLPAPNVNGANNYQSTPAFIDHTDKFDIKLDHHFSDKLNAFLRVSQRKSTELGGTFLPPPIYGGGIASGASVDGHLYGFNQGAALAATYILSPTMLLDVRFGVTRSRTQTDPFGMGGPDMMALYGIPGIPSSFASGGLTAQSVSGFTAWGRDGSLPNVQNPTAYDLPRINFSKVMGRLTLKAGFEYMSYQTEVSDGSTLYGSDSYSGQFSKPAGGTANSAVYNLADFMFGNRSGYSLSNQFLPVMEQWMAFGYVQNDFKASSRLTLNLGLRYEFATPQMEKHNNLSNLDAVNNTIVLGKAGSLFDRSTIHPNYHDFAPRVGFAYSLPNQWVIRSGFGISYVQFNRLGAEDLLPLNYPDSYSLSISQQPSQGLCKTTTDFLTCFRTTQQGYPVNSLSPANITVSASRFRYIPQDNPAAYVLAWHFSVQKQLARNLVWDVGYVGNRSLKMMVLGDYNQAAPNPPLPAAAIPLNNRRPIQGFGNIQIAWGRDNGSYHGLQTKLERRFAGGLSLLNSFTFSKAIDLAPGQLEDVSVGTVVANQNTRINYMNPNSEKGLSTTDVPYLDVFSGIWEIPVGIGRKFAAHMARPLDYVLGGWRMAAINSMYSGNPITFIYSPASDYTVSSNSKDYRPNLVGNPFLPQSQRTWQQYWNPAGLAIPPSRTQPFGNAGRNIARSPGVYTLDMGLQKEVHLPVRDETRLQFRAEAFNLQNRTNFQNANSVVGNAAFGVTQSTYPARQLQLAVKLYF
jgi:hypothetical protein